MNTLIVRTIPIALVAACSCDCPAPSDDAGFDASPDARRDATPDAQPAAAWSPPRRLVEIGSSADERFPTFAEDGLTIYFTRMKQVGSFVVNVPYKTRRPTRTAPFGPAARAASFGVTSIFDLELANSEFEWFFWKGLGQLATSARSERTSPWSLPVELGVDGFSPSLSRDGLALYFVGLDSQVRLLERATPTSPWSSPGAIDVSAHFEVKAIDISSDALTMLITAAKDSPAAGVHLANRASTSEPFESLAPITALQGAFENARFASDDREIIVAGEYAGHSELFVSMYGGHR